ncbi:MAG: cell division protein FtsZ [Clostridia bacterium]|nr:cell division protein FtsZ [Clostridia bacterium]
MLERIPQQHTKDLIKIKVLGIGGGGNNAVNQMIKSKIKGAEYILINTERQILDKANTNGCKILQIGKETAQGLGAGANPEVGEKAARESMEDINKILDNTDLVFLTAGMGGGTGTGAIPVIAEQAKKRGILTIGVVTTPFTFEGKLRTVRAEVGIEKLKPNVNSLIIISNNQLLENTDKNVSILNAFKLTDDILRQAVESITDLIQSVGTINVDFADVKTVLSYEGYSYMGIGEAEGNNKIEDATKNALKNPLTINSIDGAKGVIFNIKGGEDIGLDDINRSAEIIAESVDENANVIFGTEIDPELDKKVIVTVVATGVEKLLEKENAK